MQILVTGGVGFVGTNLCERLINDNHEVWSFDNYTTGDRKNEIVSIGQEMDEEQIKFELNLCLLSDEELNRESLKSGYEDEWPVLRAYAL